MKRLSLARQAVYVSVQGEGLLSGEPTVFVRLAGCSVGCDGCDTDYGLHSRAGAGELAAMIREALSSLPAAWAWVTGGEPTDQDLSGALAAARACGLKAALATAGTRPVRRADWDFVSVSPHRLDGSWVQREGDQVNVVPGLAGLRLEDVRPGDFVGFPAGARFVTPPADREGRPSMLRECAAFAAANEGWRVGWQAHKWWGVG